MLKSLAPPAELTLAPTVSLHGPIDETSLSVWIDALNAARSGTGPLVLELTTTGGDADVGRRIAGDVRLFREQTGRRALFLGKAVLFSAGVTIMGGFLAADRWLTRDTAVMIHGRKLTKCLNIDGPLHCERHKVEALLAEIDEGLRVQREGFESLIEGTAITMEDLEREIRGDWYLTARDAFDRGLVAGLI